jgi:hypothetical protein
MMMMTDALARWFLVATESGNQPWMLFEELLAQEDERFIDVVEKLRTDRQLRNDDTTLVVVCL